MTGDWLTLLWAALLGYGLGSIPFGLLVTRAAGAADPRTIGSGNIGATNVLRTGRKGLAAATLLLDAGKGVAAVLIAGILWPDSEGPSLMQLLAGGFAFLGHVWPLWLGFRGGKGIATLLGIAFALWWPCGLAFVVVWLGGFLLTRHSSVGGMSGAVAAPVAAVLTGRSDVAILFLILLLLVLWTHRANLERLLDGTEPRFGGKA